MSENIDASLEKGGVVTVQLLPDDYRNELFESNLEFFREFHPGLYQVISTYKPTEYRICLNPDGSPNIYNMVENNLVYEYVEQLDTQEHIRSTVKHVGIIVTVGGSALNIESVDEVNIDPLQTKMRKKLYQRGPYGRDNLAEKTGMVLPAIMSDYIPYMRVYGIGLGFHIQELIRQKNITFISIYEPNIDLFYTSMYTISWEMVFKYFSIKQRQFLSEKFHINLYLGNSPEDVTQQNKVYQTEMCRYMVLSHGRYAHFSKEERVQKLLKLEQQSDHEVMNAVSNGWYEDQRAGFYFSARNIKRNYPFFSGQKVDRFLRVFVVGNGPSMDRSLPFIKKNRENAIILSCGSTFATLLTEGIIPDFQILQERDWHLTDYEKQFDPDLLKQVTLLKLNVISPLVDKYYKDVLVFQKYNDPGSALLGEEYAVTTNVNPTVTNAGVAIAAELGADEVYLFGLDYGAPKAAKRMHASSSLYTTLNLPGGSDAVADEIELPGAFGEDVNSSKFLAWSLGVTVDKISRFPDIDWINVGDGARIEGTSAVQAEEIHNFSRKLNKKKVVEDIYSCFNSNYNSDEVIGRLQDQAIKLVSDYFDAVLSFASSTPMNREEVMLVATLMDRAMVQHKLVGDGAYGSLSYYPGYLLSGGIQDLISNFYAQSIYSNDDKISADFFVEAMDVLREYKEDVIEDIKVLVVHIAADDDVEIKLSY